MAKKILVLPGDGIGPEIVAEAVKVLGALTGPDWPEPVVDEALIGGAAIDAAGGPLPEETLERARAADAILLGAVGGPRWDDVETARRPEKGLLGLRAGLGLFANLRPAILYPQLADASTLKSPVVNGLDILIVRELTGGIYFGEPRGMRTRDDGNGKLSTRWFTERVKSSASHGSPCRRLADVGGVSAPWTRPTYWRPRPSGVKS